ncbi:MAG: N-acetylmuramoyl-L-alanine amidase family protein [Verrucomicrobiota bacterium]
MIRHYGKRTSAMFLLAGLLLGLFPPPAAGTVIRSVQHVGSTYLLLADIAHYYGMNLRTRGPRMELQSRYSHLQFERDRRQMTLNGVSVHQSFAPSLWRGQPVIGAEDFHTIIEPVLRPLSLRRKPVQRIVLDPGHGGKDSGAEGKRSEEKDIVLALARRTQSHLQKHGYEVLMTRSGDQFISLLNRSEIANRANADLFVSLHINAVDNASVRGIETFVLTPSGATSTYGSKRTSTSANGDDFIHHSMRLGYEIQRQLVAATRAKDRGIRRANFAVLRKTKAPAVLIEAGFITNRQEERRLNSADHQERMAAAITEGIRRYAKAIAPEQ